MSSLKPKTVEMVVKGWDVLFPGNKDRGQLAFLCAKFMQHLSPIYSDEEFKVAAELVEKETNFFPTVKQMIDCRESVHQVRQKQIAGDMALKALPEETGNLTEDEVGQNQKRLDIIVRQLAGEISMEEAVKEQQKLTTYARK